MIRSGEARVTAWMAGGERCEDRIELFCPDIPGNGRDDQLKDEKPQQECDGAVESLAEGAPEQKQPDHWSAFPSVGSP